MAKNYKWFTLSEQSESKGFTLVELLIVIAVIAVLVGVVLSINFQQQLKKARDGKRKVDIEQIRSALEMCRSDLSYYPSSIDVTSCTAALTCGANTYLNPIPCDPTNSGSYVYSYVAVPSGCAAAACTSYTVKATTLEMGGSYTGTPLGSQ